MYLLCHPPSLLGAILFINTIFLCSYQINIVLKLTHLPTLQSYVLDLCEFPLDYTSQRFYMMQGIVIAMTTITKYTQGARFLCSDEACPLSKGKY